MALLESLLATGAHCELLTGPPARRAIDLPACSRAHVAALLALALPVVDSSHDWRTYSPASRSFPSLTASPLLYKAVQGV